MKKLFLTALLLMLALVCLASCGDSEKPPVTTTGTPEYTVTFSVDGVTTTEKVKEGEIPVYTGETPADKLDGDKTYRFAGWDKEIAPANADATYTAVYKRVLSVRWVHATGIVANEQLADMPLVPPAECAGDLITESTVYTFVSWDRSLDDAVSEQEYDEASGTIVLKASYTESKRPYTATFKHNGEVIGTETVLYGEKPVFTGTAPTLAGYNDCGFTNTDVAATGDVVCESFFTMLDADQLLWAINRDDLSFDPAGKNDNRGSVFEEASGLIYLLLEIERAPSDSAFAAKAKEKIVGSFRYFLGDEGCMAFFSLEPYWCYVPLTAVTLLAKETPEIWDSLTALEKEKLDFMMKSFAYVLNFGNSDGNNYKSGPGFRGNFHKSWNPNYRIANVVPMLFIGKYLGGAEKLDEILLAFDYDATIAKFTEYGWTRAVKEWTKTPPTFEGVQAPSQKETMENGGSTFFVSGTEKTTSSGVGVRTPFRWAGCSADDVAGILKSVFNYNYSGGAVVSTYYCVEGGEKVAAYILDGTKSPYEGELGMMLELGKSNRSSAGYARDDFTMICAALAVLSELDMYDAETEGYVDNVFRRLWIGNMDYLYKIEHGYRSYATSSTPHSKDTYESASMAHYLWKSWWMASYGSKYTLATLPLYVEPEKPYDPNRFVESFDGQDFNVSAAQQLIEQEYGTLTLQAASPATGVYFKTVTDPSASANKYLAMGIDHGGGGINANLSTDGGLSNLGEGHTLRLSMKLAKDGSADSTLETYLRLRAKSSSDVINIFTTSTSGKLSVLGTNVATLSTTFIELTITINFETGAFTAAVDGVEKVNTTLTLETHHKNATLTDAKTLLEWIETSGDRIFNWYIKANGASAHRALLIDDLSCVAVLPETPAQ